MNRLRLLLGRHGEDMRETPRGRIYNGPDTRLTELGRWQALGMGKLVLKFLEDDESSLLSIYHSPQPRASDSAKLAGSIAIPAHVVELEDLSERRLGDLVGMTEVEATSFGERHGLDFIDTSHGRLYSGYRGDESFDELFERGERVYTAIRQDFLRKFREHCLLTGGRRASVLIISHAMIMAAISAAATGMTKEEAIARAHSHGSIQVISEFITTSQLPSPLSLAGCRPSEADLAESVSLLYAAR